MRAVSKREYSIRVDKSAFVVVDSSAFCPSGYIAGREAVPLGTARGIAPGDY
jgi:hypothetical protein